MAIAAATQLWWQVMEAVLGAATLFVVLLLAVTLLAMHRNT